MTELWSAGQAAAYWTVSLSRARAILASRKIQRVSGYPADQIKAVRLRQGARTDLAPQGAQEEPRDGPGGQPGTAKEPSIEPTATPHTPRYDGSGDSEEITAQDWAPTDEALLDVLRSAAARDAGGKTAREEQQ